MIDRLGNGHRGTRANVWLSPSSAATPIQKPDDFIGAIARPRRGDLKGVISALGEEPTLADLFSLDGQKLKQAGLPVKDRRFVLRLVDLHLLVDSQANPTACVPCCRYVLWCLERFRQGQHPAEVAYDVKPRKKIRGWGPRVQNGKRVRGQLRPGERYA